jgi:hypothetical protein
LSEGVLFPLFRPVLVTDGTTLEWSEYLKQRRGHPELTALLEPLRLTGKAEKENAVTGISGDIPGFFLAGQEPLPIQVLRPRVRP